jgi:CubicO group peptidase (beta-lactamase class C family)
MLSLRVAWLLILPLILSCTPHAQPRPLPPTPQSLAEFRAAAEQVLKETGVPGAGIALVRTAGVEWAGGVGVADRERQVAVTGDTHFRAGSISKTFVALALVQQYEDGTMDLEAPVSTLAPRVAIDNPYATPVTVLHLLQHTAGFDDMHLKERYNLSDQPDLPLIDVLALNPASRRVRWRPGTRMSYSNPGYALAAYVLEQVTGESYSDVIRNRIFTPLGMQTSSFALADAEDPPLARGYDQVNGPPSSPPEACTPRQRSWGASSRCCSTGEKHRSSSSSTPNT